MIHFLENIPLRNGISMDYIVALALIMPTSISSRVVHSRERLVQSCQHMLNKKSPISRVGFQSTIYLAFKVLKQVFLSFQVSFKLPISKSKTVAITNSERCNIFLGLSLARVMNDNQQSIMQKLSENDVLITISEGLFWEQRNNIFPGPITISPQILWVTRWYGSQRGLGGGAW